MYLSSFLSSYYFSLTFLCFNMQTDELQPAVYGIKIAGQFTAAAAVCRPTFLKDMRISKYANGYKTILMGKKTFFCL